MVLAGVLLYTENILAFSIVKNSLSFIGIDYDLKSSVPAFLRLENFIYAINLGLSPLILVFASKMHPYNKAYIIPVYAYLNMLIGSVLQYKEIEIFSFFWYRLSVFFGALLIVWLLSKVIKYYDCIAKEDEIKDLIIKNYITQIKDEAA